MVVYRALRSKDNAIGCVIEYVLNEVEKLKLVVVSALACAVEEYNDGVFLRIIVIFGEDKSVGKNGVCVFVGVRLCDFVNIALCLSDNGD